MVKASGKHYREGLSFFDVAASQRRKLKGRGTVGKTPVAGIKDRKTKKVVVKVVPDTKAKTLQPFVRENVRPGATLYTDDAGAYRRMVDLRHDSVKHSVGEYVKDVDVHTNGFEAFWSMFKRGFVGVYHNMSVRHLPLYAAEFAGRQNAREKDTLDQMHDLALGMERKRLPYKELTRRAA